MYGGNRVCIAHRSRGAEINAKSLADTSDEPSYVPSNR